MTITDRYRSGDREDAWERARSLGPRALERPYDAEIEQLALHIVDRSVLNLMTLRRRLTDLGYQFANPDRVLVDADADSIRAIPRIEGSLGRLPIIVRAWYSRVARVDFRQAPAQLAADPREDSLAGLGLHNSLLFLPLDECLRLKQELNTRLSQAGVPRLDDGFLPLGADASNAEPKGFLLPCIAADGTYYNDGSGNVGFVDELRRCFRYGGFPFWASMLGRRRRLEFAPTPSNLEALIAGLADGLHPI